MTCEECIFTIEHEGTDQVFALIVVDLGPAVRQEGLQPVPMVVDIGQLFAAPSFG